MPNSTLPLAVGDAIGEVGKSVQTFAAGVAGLEVVIRGDVPRVERGLTGVVATR